MSRIEGGGSRDSQFRESLSFVNSRLQSVKASKERVRTEKFKTSHRAAIKRYAESSGMSIEYLNKHAIFLDNSGDKQNEENIARFRKENPNNLNLVDQFSSLSREDQFRLTRFLKNPQGVKHQGVTGRRQGVMPNSFRQAQAFGSEAQARRDGELVESISASQETRSRNEFGMTRTDKKTVQAEEPIADSPFDSLFKRLTNPVARRALAISVAAGMSMSAVQAVQAEQNSTETPTPVPGYTLQFKDGIPSQNALRKMGVMVQNQTASSSFPSDITALEESQQDLESNPQNIGGAGTAFVKDSSGQVTEIFSFDQTSSYLYKTQTDSNGNFTQWQQTSENPVSVSHSSPVGNGVVTYALDSQTGILGGDNILAYFDGGQTFVDITSAFSGLAGPIQSILPIDGTNKCVVNVNATNGGVSQYVATIDEATQTVTSQAVTFKDQNGNTVALGAAAFSTLSVDNSNNTMKMLTPGSSSLQQGYTLSSLNYETGIAQIDHVTQATIDGVLTNLGWLQDIGTYTDSNGHLHIQAANNDRNLIYDVDTVTLTGTQFGYLQYGLGGVNTIEVFQSTPGGPIQTWLGGSGGAGSAVANVETGKTYLPVQGNTFINDMENINIAGQNLMYTDNLNFGNAVFTLNPDGSPNSNASFYYPDKGLGVVVVTPTPTSSPTPSVTPTVAEPTVTPTVEATETAIPTVNSRSTKINRPYVIFLPAVSNNSTSAGW
ncbi:MAG: hypothetical protein M1426_00235 [Patescibacteria group bacterium]|nr:hypothetical protein [Patescibacteria group bacterium]